MIIELRSKAKFQRHKQRNGFARSNPNYHSMIMNKESKLVSITNKQTDKKYGVERKKIKSYL